MLPIGQFAVFGVATEGLLGDEEQDPYPLDPLDAHEVLEDLAEEFPGIEAAVLAGLTRTEFYVAYEGPLQLVGEYLGARYFRFDQVPRIESMRYSYEGLDAVTQLSGVATGIAELPGHPFYAGLVADGLDRAEELGCAGSTLRSVFELALRNAEAASSIMGDLQRRQPIGVHLAAYLLRLGAYDFPHRPARVLVVGAGEQAREVSLDLALCEAGTLQLIGGDLARSQKLASACHGNALPWAALSTELVVADVVVLTDEWTDAEPSAIPTEFLQRAARLRGDRELQLIDLSERQAVAGADIGGLFVMNETQLRARVPTEEALFNAARYQIALMVNREADAWGRGHETVVMHQSLNEFFKDNQRYAMQLRPRLVPGAVASAADVKHVTLHAFRGLLNDCAAWLWHADIGRPNDVATPERLKN